MEDFDFQKYRDDLAYQIKSESDKTKRQEILSSAKKTPQYQQAEQLKRREGNVRFPEGEQTQSVAEYAEQHYGKYATFNEDQPELIRTIVENRETVNSTPLNKFPPELIESALDLLDGIPNQETVALLKRANFNYDALLKSEEDDNTKARAIVEALAKARSYDEAVVENKENPIDFSGFENDPDIADAEIFITQRFGEELLSKCLVSHIRYLPDIVKVIIMIDGEGKDFLIPEKEYAEWEQAMPEVKQRKFRAESLVAWNSDPKFSKKFIPTPIYFYSFYGEEPDNLPYLESVPAEARMKTYKLGTIAHEIGHHIYDYQMDSDMRAEWEALVNSSPPLTDYSASYDNHKFRCDEVFAESIRLKTTVPDYFKEKFPDYYEFLAKHFPEIKDWGDAPVCQVP